MKSPESFYEERNLNREIQNHFYELDFSTDENRNDIIKSLSKKIPWYIPITNYIDSIKDGTVRMTARKYLHEIQVEILNYNLFNVANKGNTNNYDDLEKMVFLLSLMGDTHANYSDFCSELDRIAYRLGELFELNKVILTDEVKVQLLTRVIHQEENFHGNHFFYHNPENSYLTRVMQTKLGIPISLSVIYILIGLRLNLPIYGVNLPLHFMILYESPNYTTYIDPFNGGVLVDRKTCKKFLEANGYIEAPEYFSKAGTISILRRMYNNLILVCKKRGDKEFEEIFSKQLQILETRPEKF